MPDAYARPRAPRACDTHRPGALCKSGIPALATRAQHGDASEGASFARRASGSVSLGPPDSTGTTRRAMHGGRSHDLAPRVVGAKLGGKTGRKRGPSRPAFTHLERDARRAAVCRDPPATTGDPFHVAAAEREGFEPSMDETARTGFRERHGRAATSWEGVSISLPRRQHQLRSLVWRQGRPAGGTARLPGRARGPRGAVGRARLGCGLTTSWR